MVIATMAIFACLATSLSTGTASADHQTKNGGVHWGRYRWGAGVASPERIFWILDRTGNPTMQQAIQQWVQSWNGQRNLNVKSAPRVMYLQDNAWIGACGNFNMVGYSFITFCSGDPGTTGVTGLLWSGSHITNPYVIVRPGGLNYGQLFTAITHEMGHVLGLSHRPEVGKTMHANANFNGHTNWYDQHDLDALNALYGGHAD